jgi:hypothetical protein
LRGDVAEWLGRGLQSLVQRFESARRLLLALTTVLAVVGCSTGEERPVAPNTPDAEYLVPQLADLPIGFNLVPAESFPIPTSKILADPWQASSAAIIRRERVSGYQVSFTSPQAVRLQCSAAVYRSSAAARKVYRLRTSGSASFIGELGGRSLPVAEIGEETHAHRFDIGSAEYLGVAWRFRTVLSTCIAGDFARSPMAEVIVVARAQQARIASALDGGQR